MFQASRHYETPTEIHLYVYEDNPEALARHVLLVSILLDDSLLPKVRMERFLEVFGNALLRGDTADYVKQISKRLEEVMAKLSAGETPEDPLGKLFSFSDLRYSDRDGVLDAIRNSRRPAKDYDMAKAWDTRCRHWYGDRFDFRRNMVRFTHSCVE